MKLTRTKPEDAKLERYIITGLIVSTDVCLALRKTYDPQFFQTKLTREVANWCFNFYKKYESAPKQDIQTIFETKMKAGKIDPDLGDEIEQFLSNLSEEYEEDEQNTFNVQFYVDMAQKYFKKRSFVLFSNQIRDAAENDQLTEAEKIYAEYTRVQEQQDTSRKPLEASGIEACRESLQSRPPFLFKMPGDLGRMIGPIERETFIAFLGREKAGKTFVLQAFAEAGVKQGLKVAIIEAGDLTQDQLDTRIYSSRTGKVAREEKEGKHFVPIMDCLWNQKGRCDRIDSDCIVQEHPERKRNEFTVDINDPDIINGHTACIECYKDRAKRHKFKGSIWWKEKQIKAWTWGDVKRRTKKFRKHFKGELITIAFPMRTVRMSDVRDWVLSKYKQNGWLPDLLIIDYPDIMLPEDSKKEHRHSENEKWMLARQMSQEFHNCVLVATQADAKAYNRDTLQLDNYSESKTKYAHTTHFFAINKTVYEEEMGCCRISGLILREDSLKVSQQVTLIQELITSRPYVASFFGRVPAVGK